MSELSIAIGQLIRIQRKLKKISQEDLSLQSGIDRSYLGRIERGEVNISIEKLYMIASILDIEPQELLPSSKFKE